MKIILTCLILSVLSYVKSGYISVPLKKSFKEGSIRQEVSYLQKYAEQEKQLISLEQIQSLSQVSIVPIMNYFDIQYYGYIYLGSNLQPMSVIFDTGSNILWVESKNCTQCRNFTNKFDFDTSTTFTDGGITKNITYAIGFVDGILAKDKVYINKEIGVDLNFLVVNYEDRLAGTVADGVLGLGIEKEGDNQNSLIYSLYLNKMITSPSFAFYLTESKKESRLYIGDITENPFLSPTFDRLQYVHLNNNSHYWESNLNSVKTFNRHNITDLNYTFQSNSKVIFDTGTSFLIIPAFDVLYLIPALTNKALDNKCALTPYLQIICKCSSPQNFDDIELSIGNSKFYIRTDDIIEFYPTLEYQCRFEIIVDIFMLDSWILGDSVLRYTLLTFDMDKRRIGYIQDLPKISDDTIIGNVNTKSTSYGLFEILVWISASLLALLLAYLIYKCCFGHNQEPEYKQLNR